MKTITFIDKKAVKEALELKKLREEAVANRICPVCGNDLEEYFIQIPGWRLKLASSWWIFDKLEEVPCDEEVSKLQCSKDATHYNKRTYPDSDGY